MKRLLILALLMCSPALAQTRLEDLRQAQEISKEAGARWDAVRAYYTTEVLEKLAAVKVKTKNFEGCFRASKSVLSATESGVSYRDYGPLLQPFLGEVSIAKDLAITDDEKTLAKAYQDAADVYGAGGRYWSANLHEGAGRVMGLPWLIARHVLENANAAYLAAYRKEQEPTPVPTPIPTTAPTPKKQRTRKTA
jgi:hypothetical protein